MPVLAFASIIAVNTLMVSPAYTPAGLFHPLMLAVTYLVVRSIEDRAELSLAYAALLAGAMIAVWGLAQISLPGTARATAIFEAPATYAAVLNLMLVPSVSALILGRRERVLVMAAVLLSAALFAADSRGGFVALVAGLGAALLFGLRARLLRPRAIGLTLALIAAGWLATSALRAVPAPESVVRPSAEARAESSVSRLELYALSWNAWREHPVTGTGFLTFRYVLEQGRMQVPTYGETDETWFVHNDYLQTLQELGPAGLLMLVALTALPALLAYRRLPALAGTDRTIVAASASALVATAVHALVDFPFYVPACLFLYGVWLGALDRRLSALAPDPAWRSALWYRPLRAGAMVIAVVVLLRPVAAEAAAGWGLRLLAEAHGQRAAVWLGVARRIDQADWRYHWYAGQFWSAQAAQSGKREAARLAAEAYAAGYSANPLEVRNLLGMISVHRRYRQLLDTPADVRTLQVWLERAAALAPYHPALRQENVR